LGGTEGWRLPSETQLEWALKDTPVSAGTAKVELQNRVHRSILVVASSKIKDLMTVRHDGHRFHVSKSSAKRDCRACVS
jgi:hypothetical protein